MKTHNIVQLGDQVLRESCVPVDDLRAFADTATRLRIECYSAQRLGVAAPQLGIAARAFSCWLSWFDTPKIFINPSITMMSPQTHLDQEGCLSVADQWFQIRRAVSVAVTAQDETGATFSLSLDGIDARVVQHEVDHLDGILVIDRAREQSKTLSRQLRRGVERRLNKLDV